jgi:hypothetical protein
MIEDDLYLDPTNLEKKLFQIPGLHGKYLGLYFNAKQKLNNLEKKLAVMYKTKYYEYKDGDLVLDKKEIQFNILGDKEYSDLNFTVNTVSDLVDILDRTVKKVNNMSFDVKNLVAYLEYLQGV